MTSIGLASLGSDAGHELTTSLLPSLLTTVLGAGPGALGLVEGLSDALIGLSKLAGGPLSNDPRRRRRLASGGYLVTAAATALIGLTTAVWQVGLFRAVSWIGRGVRTPARDALLMSLVPARAYGRASGVERAGDNAGAMLGPLLAVALLSLVGIRAAMLCAIVPGLFAAFAIGVAAREAREAVREPAGRRTLSLNLGQLRAAGLATVMIPIAAFEIGNISNTLLILRATDILRGTGQSTDAATMAAILMYAAHNATAALTSLLAGTLADRFGARGVFIAGAAGFVVGYTLFGFGTSWWTLIMAVVACGAGIGCVETAQSAMIAHTLPDNLRGSGYAALGLTQSIGDLGASTVVGVLWASVSASVGFAYAASWMTVAVFLAMFGARRTPRHGPERPTPGPPVD